MKRPENMIYAVDETPPPVALAGLSVQHVCVFAISLIFPVLLARQIDASAAATNRLVAMSMLAAALTTVLQSLRRGPIGGGWLCPSVCGPSFLAASIMAAKAGGLPLMFGMTLVAGFAEAIFARFLKYLRVLFPVEVTGLIVAMVGLTVTGFAVSHFFGMRGNGDFSAPHLIVATLTLATMIGLNVWGKGKLRLFCVLIGIAVGYAGAIALGILGSTHVDAWRAMPLLTHSLFKHPGFAFSGTMVLPFVIAILCSSLKSVADLSLCQKINDEDWRRPDMPNISKGLLVDAIGAMAAGLFGGFGQSTSSTNIGLSQATGATSRRIAHGMAILLVAMALCPKITGLFVIMPDPVMGATLVFALAFMVMAGFQIVMSRMIDSRKTFVVGVSMILGLGADVVPHVFDWAPAFARPVFASSLSTATVCAVVLNLIMRLGIAKRATIILRPGPDATDAWYSFVHKQGGAWGARREVMQRVFAAVNEFLELAGDGMVNGDVTVTVSFDELQVAAQICYTGMPLEFPDAAPTPTQIVEQPDRLRELGAFLIRRHADRSTLVSVGDDQAITLRWEH